ncbi:endoplasmic reticulum protein [Trichosporon asahii var. asahii CBS 2479]|uniref:Endoplasmic reticulum protein n=1 Tax=Trichosporon asahii var. asahii (strain ATCC 90039 / CBS 2479 / JCM 2466 / KCTC 7840 / NBRC 103889/ NCYC 2677 / UAMH 7654) TaxID=1186058 RepID=J6ERF6_TRIAS|nr:endoplasmic reticulum protein [Trichosporon asahii var. asahii CBS 2479]EJT45302.1 endoplasmic reticulum protein [Trichosporon asahii var. asahii CBS 2479]
MPDGHWRASNGAAIGPARTNGTAQPKPNGTAHSGGKVKMTLDADAKHDPQAIDQTAVSEEVSRPKVVDPEWGELTLEKAREKLLEQAPRNPLWRSSLFRRLYLLCFVLFSLLVLVPVWALYYFPRSNRPFGAWPLQRCLRVRWSRHISTVVAKCEIDYLGRNLDVPLHPYKLKCSHPIIIPPAPASWLRGHPAEMLKEIHKNRGNWRPRFVYRHWPTRSGAYGKWNPRATPSVPEDEGFVPVQAFWYTGRKIAPHSQPRRRHAGQPVLLMFHGGGYILGTAAESDLTSSVARSFVAHTPIRHVLSVEYRLASTSPWPLPLLDAISAYHHLLSEGVAERDIVIAGDSAGGHLSLALARWLRDEGPALGLSGPRGLVLLSPWSDLGFTHFWGERNAQHNAELDTIDGSFGPFAASLLLRGLDEYTAWESPYLAPAGLMLPERRENGFHGFPPTFIVYGRAERLEMEIRELYRRIKAARSHRRVSGDAAAAGAVGEDGSSTPGGEKRGKRRTTRDRLLATREAVHDFMIFPWFNPETSAAYEEIDDWLRHLFSIEAAPRIETTPPTPDQLEVEPVEKVAERERERLAERERRIREREMEREEREASLEKTEAALDGIRQRPRARTHTAATRPVTIHTSALPPSLTRPSVPRSTSTATVERRRKTSKTSLTPRPRIRLLPKSPRMMPVHDTPRAFVRDLRTQSLDLIDLHPVDMLEDVLSPLRLDERGDEWPSWHEMGAREPSEEDEERYEEEEEEEEEDDDDDDDDDDEGEDAEEGEGGGASASGSEPPKQEETHDSEDGSEERWLFE